MKNGHPCFSHRQSPFPVFSDFPGRRVNAAKCSKISSVTTSPMQIRRPSLDQHHLLQTLMYLRDKTQSGLVRRAKSTSDLTGKGRHRSQF